MTSLGLYFYLQHFQPEIAVLLPWLPLTASMLFIVTYNMAWAPVPILIMAELLPIQIKAVGGTISIIVMYTANFMLVKYSAILEAKTIIGYAGVFWIYAAINLFNALFTYFCLPETKGKTLEDIDHLYDVRKKKDIFNNESSS